VATLRATPVNHAVLGVLFRSALGVGGLTSASPCDNLGMSLGMAMVLGYCAAFGTLMPADLQRSFVSQVLARLPVW